MSPNCAKKKVYTRRAAGAAAMRMVCGMFLLSATGCAPEKKQNSGKKQIYTSFYLLADFAEKIVGDRMDVHCIMPVGSNVHNWELTPKKMLDLSKADAFLYNGAGLEPWCDKVLPQLEKENVKIFEAAKCVRLLGNHECDCGEHESHDEHETHGEHEPHTHAGPDPHIWLSLKNVAFILSDLADFVCRMEPENETFYRENLRKALEECGTLDAEFQSVLDKISCRQIVVSHCAFGYLCRDYGLEQAALEGYSAFSDPSPAQMVKIIEFIKKNQISVIFTASNENSKGAEAIARETGVKISVLHPLGTLTQAQMDSNADYFSLMRENLEALKTL